LPEGFPKDVPLCPGATVKMSVTSGQGLMVHLESAASAADVAKFYNEQLEGNGWKIEQTMNMGEVRTLSAKKDQRQCTVTCTKDGQKTLVQIYVVPEKS
jgi:outer membrane lipopolysaccharide assembly protein LptE/RlpB